jgi:hypothetical protein
MLYYAIQPFKTGLPHAIQPFPSIPFHIDLCPVSRLSMQTSFSEELDTFSFSLDDLRLASFDECLQ